jgi:hypothetical protein
VRAQERAGFAAAPPAGEGAVAAEPARPAGSLLRLAPPEETAPDDDARLEAEVAEYDVRAPLRAEGLARERKASAAARRDEPEGSEESRAELRRLYRERPVDAAGWRELREAWRAFAATYPESAWADEARMRTVEAGIEAWEAGADPADRARALEDARAYLARDDALLKAAVRELIEQIDGG